MSISISVKDLLDAGVHFGHQTKRWNPRSKPYVFDHRQGITIIDLGKTHALLQKACTFLTDTVGNGGTVLLVGTKRQAQDIIREAASSTGMPYCVDRWLGGTLTNFATVKKSIAKFKRYQAMETSGEMSKQYVAKEIAAIKREMGRMQKNFAGIVDMETLPDAIFLVDTSHEAIAAAEGKRANIPTVALVDTNSDPTGVKFPIPGNDDAVKSIRIIMDAVIEAIQAGLSQRDSRRTSRAQADLKAATAAVAAAAGVEMEATPEMPAEAVAEDDAASTEEVPAVGDLAKKKPAVRKKIAAPKAVEQE